MSVNQKCTACDGTGVSIWKKSDTVGVTLILMFFSFIGGVLLISNTTDSFVQDESIKWSQTLCKSNDGLTGINANYATVLCRNGAVFKKQWTPVDKPDTTSEDQT